MENIEYSAAEDIGSLKVCVVLMTRGSVNVDGNSS